MFCSWLLVCLFSVVALFICSKSKNKAATQTSTMLSPGAVKPATPTANDVKAKDKSKETSNKVASVEAKKTEKDEEKKGEEKKEKKEDTPEEKKNKKKKEEKGGDKKKEAEKIIQDAIKAGDLLPPDDNETINDCESNWGVGVKEDKKN